MASINNHHLIFLFTISSLLFASTSVLPLSNATVEAPGDDGWLPLAKKHVVIRNTILSTDTMNVHCKSSEDDLGLIQIPFGHSWGFKFHVNMWKTTKFRCHFFWYHSNYYFDIFKVSRDDTPSAGVCKECIWEVGKFNRNGICRINRDGSYPDCYTFDTHP
ncbi:hypothetical protein CARUB_v10019070mg [Capsella rubella]|uniref:S-protein homolog n=1 Tax=Capsella rubella TaxID=81985 RepID=R0FSA3_9BRAS|nr:S-protein homolog 5 [Capsella rubella]EOA25712.1 hypothetical protein CARUB_v10019070mg [Capsella rubella]